MITVHIFSVLRSHGVHEKGRGLGTLTVHLHTNSILTFFHCVCWCELCVVTHCLCAQHLSFGHMWWNSYRVKIKHSKVKTKIKWSWSINEHLFRVVLVRQTLSSRAFCWESVCERTEPPARLWRIPSSLVSHRSVTRRFCFCNKPLDCVWLLFCLNGTRLQHAKTLSSAVGAWDTGAQILG